MTRSNSSFEFKIATEEWELAEIHRLLYRTFVEEIPQYHANEERRLVDKFHDQNTYLICLDGPKLAGIITLRDRRPFSLDAKLPDLDTYLPPGRNVCEIRLLSVEKGYRHSAVLPGLIALLEKHGRVKGFNTAIISGTTRQLKLCQHLGFVPFGPMVGTPGAMYQPMMLTYENYRSHMRPALNAVREAQPKERPLSFLPGPVSVHSSIIRAFSEQPVSHRSRSFLEDFRCVRSRLCTMVGASKVEIMLGTGTLANDVIAGQLALLGQSGLILTNGEFGERLIDHAIRMGLTFDSFSRDWGEGFSFAEVHSFLNRSPRAGWLWAVHCETSTGVLNDIEMLAELCREGGKRLVLDCVSTIGIVPIDLKGVFLASAVSGKGLGSLAGLAMVFYHHQPVPAPHRLPRYLDLGYYSERDGIPFTHSSNLLSALQAALDRIQSRDSIASKRELSDWLRSELLRRGFNLMARDTCTSPAVVTLALPHALSSEEVGLKLEEAGFQLSYRSEYLRRRNLMQICLMGECCREDLLRLLERLTVVCRADPAAGVVAQSLEHSGSIR
jgi:aspartate aminotransferase-like enzyme